jgi:hypothetical protein
VVLLANDGAALGASLDSIAWAGGCVAVDLGCTDATVTACRERGVSVVAPDELAAAVARAAPGWVLLLEGHERVTGELAAEIRTVTAAAADGEPAGYAIARSVEFLGRRLRCRAWSEPRCPRLVRPRALVWAGDPLTLVPPGVTGPVRRLEHRLLARPYASLQHYVSRVDVLAAATAWRGAGGRPRPRWTDLMLRPAARAACRLPAAALRDGVVGIVFVVLESYARVLVAAKRWELAERLESAEARR